MAAKLLTLAAAAHAFITPVRRLRPTQPLRAIPLDAVELTTHTLAANSALTSTADELAGSLFGASLLPWLAMLYWLKHPKTQAPRGVCFGLTYLLAFVFGSIPAAIGAAAACPNCPIAPSEPRPSVAGCSAAVTSAALRLPLLYQVRSDAPSCGIAPALWSPQSPRITCTCTQYAPRRHAVFARRTRVMTSVTSQARRGKIPRGPCILEKEQRKGNK